MLKQSFDEVIDTKLAEAQKSRIKNPAVVFMDEDSDVSRTIKAELPDGSSVIFTPDNGSASGLLGVWPVSSVARLLRRHASVAGGGVANLLAAPPIQPQYWVLWIQADGLTVAGFRGREICLHAGACYPGVRFDAVDSRDAKKSLPSRLSSKKNGHAGSPEVDGNTEKLAAMARILVAIVEGRCLPAIEPDFPLPLRSAQLAQILAHAYGEFPGVIAVTIAFLHEKGGHRERWLLEVLQSRPELHALAEAVHQELWGG
jgi:hypothetical protein